MKQQEHKVTGGPHSATAPTRRLRHEHRGTADPSRCWCGSRKVKHVVAGHPTVAYECPYHFMPDQQRDETRSRLFLDHPTKR